MTQALETEHIANRIRFLVSGILMICAFIWLFTNTGMGAIAIITIIFICFLRNGIRYEMSARSLADEHGGH